MRFRGNLPDILMLVSFFFFFNLELNNILFNNAKSGKTCQTCKLPPWKQEVNCTMRNSLITNSKIFDISRSNCNIQINCIERDFFKKIPHLHSILWEQGTMTKNITNPQQYVLFITGKLSKSHASMHNVYFA